MENREEKNGDNSVFATSNCSGEFQRVQHAAKQISFYFYEGIERNRLENSRRKKRGKRKKQSTYYCAIQCRFNFANRGEAGEEAVRDNAQGSYSVSYPVDRDKTLFSTIVFSGFRHACCYESREMAWLFGDGDDMLGSEYYCLLLGLDVDALRDRWFDNESRRAMQKNGMRNKDLGL